MGVSMQIKVGGCEGGRACEGGRGCKRGRV